VDGRARIDSRAVTAGDLFCAFVGENTDGHRFLENAHAAGAVLSLVTRPSGPSQIQVADVERALADLAQEQLVRARELDPQLRVVAVTGSAGKTGTKDMLAALLASQGETIATLGSHNNELGLPLTVLGLTPTTRYLVLEMGARGIGHIAYLTTIAPPDVSLVLNVGSAHLGEFGSVEAIAQAKGEIVEALGPEGCAVLNADDPRVAAMATRTSGAVLTWGRAPSQIRLTDLELDPAARARIRIEVAEGVVRPDGTDIDPGSIEVPLQVLGEHQAANAMAATTAALALGLTLDQVAAVLPTIRPASGQRMEAIDVHGARDVLVINDAYNANPESMRQALRTLAHLGTTRRTIAVLGEMLELGEDSLRLHDEVGRLAVRLNISHLVVVGEKAAAIHRGACLEASFDGESELVADADAALARLLEILRDGDVVLLKSSRDAGLRVLADRLVDALTQDAPPTAQRADTGPATPSMADSDPGRRGSAEKQGETHA
jgi:UDP-N-acetylmuramoyl-tripeptide--D-alanyl-D-alanine ligase